MESLLEVLQRVDFHLHFAILVLLLRSGNRERRIITGIEEHGEDVDREWSSMFSRNSPIPRLTCQPSGRVVTVDQERSLTSSRNSLKPRPMHQ